MNIINNYKINEFTLAIMPYGDNYSICYEIGDKLIIRNKPGNIMKKNCIIYGSSIQGRRNYTENLTGYIYKAPILVKEDQNLIFFPTNSPRSKHCGWINLKNLDYASYDTKKCVTRVRFINGLVLEINVSLNIINNQIFRATRLEHKIRKNYA